MPQYLPAVIPGQGPVEDAKVRSYPVSGPVPGTGRTGYTPNFTFPEPPQAPPSPGWFKRTASALRDGVAGLGERASAAAAPLGQRLGEAADFVAGESAGPTKPSALGRAGSALRVVGRAAPVVGAVAGEADNLSKAWDEGGVKGATRAAESVARVGGTVAGAEAGAIGGAALGSLGGPLAPVTIPAGAIVGGLAGAWAGPKVVDKAVSGLRSTFGLESAPLATAPTAAGPDPRLQNPGRGVGFDDPRRLDMDNTRGSLRESRNFAPELASVPAQLPDNLREGVVFKTKDASGRTVYSGKNIKGDIQLVDGLGATQASRGASSVVPAGPATGLSGAGQGVAMGSALAASQQPMQTEPGGFNTGRNGNAFVRSPEQQRADAATQASSIDPRTRALGLRTLDSLDKSDAAQLASETAKFNARAAADAAMYGADRNLEGNLAQAQATGLRYGYDQRLKATQMAIQAQAMQMAGGDTRKAAQLILQMGGDPSNLIQAATGFQGLDTKNNEDARGYFRGMATMLDKDDKPYTNEALQNQLYDTAMRMTSGKWASMNADERQALAPEVQAAVQAVGGMNRLRNNGLLQMIGWDPATPEISQLPELRGATYGRVGKVSGALTPGDVSRGDYEIRTAKGDTYYIPADQASERVLRMLENNGATKRKD